MQIQPIEIVLAKRAYKTYGKAVDFKNYQGNPMPEFDELPEKIKNAWIQVIKEIDRWTKLD